MSPRFLLAAVLLVLGACRGSGEDTGYDAGPLPTYCNADWQSDLQDAVVGELGGTYLGVYTTLPEGTWFNMKFVPPHPFWLQAIRLDFTSGSGPVTVRLTPAYGRSYPSIDLPDDSPDGDLVEPIELEVENASKDDWLELDLSEEEIYLEPTQHYVVTVIPEGTEPYLGVEDLLEGEDSRALMIVPGEDMPYGSEGNFRIELAGQTFCTWSDGERWFGEDTGQPFAGASSSRAAFTDLDGDGFDDLMVQDGGPQVYLGDGAGGFSGPHEDLLAEAADADMLLFGDLDNDGDQDAFASLYVGADDDGDGYTKEEGDCDDTDTAVYPGASEDLENGYDDDCDGVADAGLDESDADGDGVTIAEGDCDDTDETVFPDAEEVEDDLDNDCDGATDEDTTNYVLLNDGTGVLEAVAESGVEYVDPSTAAGFGDANRDGILDLYYGNWLEHYPDDPAVQDRFFFGLGGGEFEDATESAGLVRDDPDSCYGVMWTDFDNDGWTDIYVGNYHLYANQLWRNLGDGTFEDVAEEVGVAYDDVPSGYSQYPGGHSYGGDFGDVDCDGDLDFYMANLAHPRTQPWGDPTMFVVNAGEPDYTFTNERESYGFIYDEGDVNAAFADYDNDMDLDLVVASLYTNHYSRLYRNDRDAGFTDVTYQADAAIHDAVSAVWADADSDGDLDLVIADRHDAPYVHLLVNRVGQDNHWLQLDLRGTDTNAGAVGARVRVVAGGRVQMRDIRGGGGHWNTQNSRIVHFGLGSHTRIEYAEVEWPGGETEELTGLEADGRYVVTEGQGVGERLF